MDIDESNDRRRDPRSSKLERKANIFGVPRLSRFHQRRGLCGSDVDTFAVEYRTRPRIGAANHDDGYAGAIQTCEVRDPGMPNAPANVLTRATVSSGGTLRRVSRQYVLDVTPTSLFCEFVLRSSSKRIFEPTPVDIVIHFSRGIFEGITVTLYLTTKHNSPCNGSSESIWGLSKVSP